MSIKLTERSGIKLHSIDLPAALMKTAEKFFPLPLLLEGVRLLKRAQVQISFQRGSLEKYFVVSAMVKDLRILDCKIIHKKHQVTEEWELKSFCNCPLGKDHQLCPHTAALLLRFLDEQYHHQRPGLPLLNEGIGQLPPLALLHGHGVSVNQYGKIISTASKLLGAPPNASFFSLHYLLHSQKITNFPTPEEFNGKLILAIDLHPEKKNLIPDYPGISITFAHQLADGPIEKKISLFEHLYCFHWGSGKVYNLPAVLQQVVQKIRLHSHQYQLEDYLIFGQIPEIRSHLELYLDGQAFFSLPAENSYPTLLIEENPHKKMMVLNFQFFTSSGKLTTPPAFLKAMVFTNGLLSTFHKKKDAYEFLSSLYQQLQGHLQNYPSNILYQLKKDQWQQLLLVLTTNSFSCSYQETTHQRIIFDNHLQSLIFTAMFECFGEIFFRFSEFHPANLALEFSIPQGVLRQGIGRFYHLLTPFGVLIKFKGQEIRQWHSQMRLIRRQSHNNWFHVELQLTPEDLAVVEQTNANDAFSFTAGQLFVLGPQQQELIKVVKKFLATDSSSATSEQIAENPPEGTRRVLIPFQRNRIFELFELKKLGLDGALTPEEEQLCEQLSSFDQIPAYPIPTHLNNIIRPYQITGVRWLRFLYEHQLGACLADDMGLGKTLQSIAFLESIYDQIEKALIICPVSLLINWENEIRKFSQMKHWIYHGDNRHIPSDCKIILTSYGVLKKEVDSVFSQQKFDILILDEVQQLKNFRSLGAHAARKITARFRICMTGTPVENELSEFFNILDLCVPGIWGDVKLTRLTSPFASRLLAKNSVAPFILRRTKKQVLTDLPPKIENNVFLTLSDDERLFYQKKLIEIKKRIVQSALMRKYGEMLKGLLELRQACLWQKNAQGDGVHSTKIDFLMENLEQIQNEGHQSIIFSQFTTYLNLIEQTIAKKHWKISRIDGGQSIKARQSAVDNFQSHKSSIFLISLKAGGFGLNLTAASYVFVMDPWWNPAVENQAIDRAHRIGQSNTLTVYRPLIKDSVEEKILQLQSDKKQLFEDLLATDEDRLFSGKLTMKDFEGLFF